MNRFNFLLLVFAVCTFSCTAMDLAHRRTDEPLGDPEAATVVVADGECSICFDSLKSKKPVTTLGCGSKTENHQFHTACLKGWTHNGSGENEKCPLCRANLPPDLLPAPPQVDCLSGCCAVFYFLLERVGRDEQPPHQQ